MNRSSRWSITGSKRKGRKCSGWGVMKNRNEEEKVKRGSFGREEVEERIPKIFFMSRTHLQLLQFVKDF